MQAAVGAGDHEGRVGVAVTELGEQLDAERRQVDCRVITVLTADGAGVRSYLLDWHRRLDAHVQPPPPLPAPYSAP